MFSIKPPVVHLKDTPKNKLGLSLSDYQGGLSTLCGGCGHDSITHAVIQACFESSLVPHKVAKFSGIGCSSKTPAYFLSQAHGFNSVHGRMPSVVTGAHVAEPDLHYIAVSGDGDTGSIGLGQFMHVIRRQVNMVYLLENNGVYGLTKGQFSATSDQGSVSKKQDINPFAAMDLVSLAIQLGAGFVARSFSGDKAQLVPLIKAALAYPGFALIDVLSPCVSFNNHDASTKSYAYVRKHEEEPLHLTDYVPLRSEIEIDYGEGAWVEIPMHDGGMLKLKKIAPHYDPTDKKEVLSYLSAHAASGSIVTGLLFCQPYDQITHFAKAHHLPTTPLRDIPWEFMQPGLEALDLIHQRLR